MNKKRLFIIIFLVLILVSAVINTSCTNNFSVSNGNGLMGEASPETSALFFYHFDGETVVSHILFDQDSKGEIIEKLNSVPASKAYDWSLVDITLPVYGLSISDTSGHTLNVAWSNGYWISRDREVYTFDFDFETLRDFPWQSPRTSLSFTNFPNARLLAKDENGWNSTLMTSSRPVEDSMRDDIEGITMTLVDWDSEKVNVVISNDRHGRNEFWEYGEHFILDVLLDNQWYSVPPPQSVDFVDIGFAVCAGSEKHHTFWISNFGDLPSGTYRIVSYGLYVIFDL